MKMGMLSFFVVCSMSAFAQSDLQSKSIKVLYGEDNRVDAFESTNEDYKEWSRSTAAMVPVEGLETSQNAVTIKGRTLQERGICASERFSHQKTGAMCSGFLVGPRLLVTAGHCITKVEDCAANRWVFDYRVEDAHQSEVSVPSASIYSCTKVISRQLQGGSGNDYALVELDRDVTDRSPLPFRREGRPSTGDSLVVIGHPSGLPTKIADGASIRSMNPIYFIANLDTYGGNSGSAVFNTTTGVVEGILVRGENDYEYDSAQKCRVSTKCSDTGCRGEDVTYITNVPGLR